MRITLPAYTYINVYAATGLMSTKALLVLKTANKALVTATVSVAAPLTIADSNRLRHGAGILPANLGNVWFYANIDTTLDVAYASPSDLSNTDFYQITDDADTVAGVASSDLAKTGKRKVIGLLKIGQSNERGSVYGSLIYTSASIVGDGVTATLATTLANNLAEGEIIYGTVTGATPAGFNVSGVMFTATGTFPNRVLKYASTVTGSATVQGTLNLDIRRSYPQAFRSITNPATVAPIWPSTAPSGGWDYRFKDRLSDELDIDLRIVNAALGSMSMVKHAAGQVDYWNASTHYSVARPVNGPDDYGDVGSLLVVNNAMWQCTAGGDLRYASYLGANRLAGVNQKQLDYVAVVAGGVSGASAPSWPATGTATLNQTVSDNNLVWTCISTDVTGTSDSAIRGQTPGNVFWEGGIGFDPLGILARATRTFGAISSDLYDKVVVLQNGQSDTASTAAWYAAALKSIATYFTGRGFKVAVGMTCFNPKTTAAAYETVLVAGRNSILTDYAATVLPGPDLYTGLGNVHGSGGLYTESDNTHSGENIHISAFSALKAADLHFDWFSGLVAQGKI